MKNHQRLKGLIAAAFTPMDENGEINLSAIGPYAQRLVQTGITGVFACGTTGESASLTLDERKAIAAEWVRVAKGKLKIIIHVGSNSQPQAAHLARHAQTIGADAIASLAPNFFKPATVEDLIDFLAPIARSADELPFYYYHMPSMTGVCLPVAPLLTEGKKRIPTLAGVKFTHNDLMEMGDCIHIRNGEFEVLHGYDEIFICGLTLGAIAGVGSTYNYIPHIYTGILEAMAQGNVEKARKLQMKSIEVVKIIIRYGGGVRGGKAIMKLTGCDCGNCRSPLSAFSAHEYDSLKDDLQKIGMLK